MSVSIPSVTLHQGATVAIGATSIANPISISAFSLPLAQIEIPDVGSNTTVAVPGKQGISTATIEANYSETEFTTILGFKTARAQKDLVVTTAAVLGGSNTGIFTCSGYVMDVKTPQIQDGATTPLSYSIDFMILSIALT